MNDLTPPPHEDGYLESLSGGSAMAPPERRDFIRCVPLDEIVTKPRSGYRVKGIFPAKGTALIYGPSSCGKTFLSLDLVGAITQGHEWFAHRTKPCPVVIIAAEGEQGIADRLNAYLMQNGGMDMPLEVIPYQIDMLTSGDHTQAVIEEIRLAGERIGKVELVVIDTLNRVCPGGDEAAKDMSAFLANVDTLRRAIDGLAVIVHHTGKDATKGARGHSSLIAAVDAAVEVSREGDYREWKLVKSRDGADGEAHPFKLETVELGRDEDGDVITSCIVGTAEAQKRRSAKLPASARIALKALEDAIEKRGESLPAQFQVAASVRAVKLETWRTFYRTATGAEGDKERVYFNRAKTTLIDTGAIKVSDPWVWVP